MLIGPPQHAAAYFADLDRTVLAVVRPLPSSQETR